MPEPRILVGTDFSEGSRLALDAAVQLAGPGRGATFHLAHALPKAPSRLAGAERKTFQAAVHAAEVEEAAQLSSLAEALRKKGVRVETALLPGKPADALLKEAARLRAGLIAVGTAGRQGIDRVFVGSVSDAVLRHSPIPVLVTPSRHRRGRRKMGPVLAALDLGPGSKAVLDAALALARELRVGLHVLHAQPITYLGVSVPETGMALTPEMVAADEMEAAADLSALCEPARAHVPVRAQVALGDPVAHLLAAAAHLGASAIVVGRRAKGRRLGSVSSALTHVADRPVLVVPAPAKRA